MAAHQAPPSLGFSRQELWSGLPFPFPVHESEKWKGSCSVVSNFATPWTAAYQAPQSMGFSRQEYWSGLPLPSPTARYSLAELTKLCNPHPAEETKFHKYPRSPFSHFFLHGNHTPDFLTPKLVWTVFEHYIHVITQCELLPLAFYI